MNSAGTTIYTYDRRRKKGGGPWAEESAGKGSVRAYVQKSVDIRGVDAGGVGSALESRIFREIGLVARGQSVNYEFYVAKPNRMQPRAGQPP